jgi:hypothetical protein
MCDDKIRESPLLPHYQRNWKYHKNNNGGLLFFGKSVGQIPGG